MYIHFEGLTEFGNTLLTWARTPPQAPAGCQALTTIKPLDTYNPLSSYTFYPDHAETPLPASRLVRGTFSGTGAPSSTIAATRAP